MARRKIRRSRKPRSVRSFGSRWCQRQRPRGERQVRRRTAALFEFRKGQGKPRGDKQMCETPIHERSLWEKASRLLYIGTYSSFCLAIAVSSFRVTPDLFSGPEGRPFSSNSRASTVCACFMTSRGAFLQLSTTRALPEQFLLVRDCRQSQLGTASTDNKKEMMFRPTFVVLTNIRCCDPPAQSHLELCLSY